MQEKCMRSEREGPARASVVLTMREFQKGIVEAHKIL